MWVSDSAQDKLFAHDLESGERQPDSDIDLTEHNADSRGIWSDGVTLWVLDDGDNTLFAYDLASGALLAEYASMPPTATHRASGPMGSLSGSPIRPQAPGGSSPTGSRL